ncbi:MAG: flagellum-specific ATP synthase FliI, partial [Burkholderiaceae bacterium]
MKVLSPLHFDAVADAAMARTRAPAPMREGSLVRVVGLTLEARGVHAPLGAVCEVVGDDGQRVEAEVVGFQEQTVYLMPFGETKGIGPGSRVRVMEPTAHAKLGPELLGRVVGPRGEPLDGRPAPDCKTVLGLDGLPLNAMERGPIHDVLDVGVKAINGMLTMGKGQRIGLIAGSGVGKSSLLGMLTRYTKADLVVIGLIGERGREVQSFIQESLGPEGLARSVVVAAPANVSAILRLQAVQYPPLISEYFR